MEESKVKVLDQINATNLSNRIGTERFDNIVFQFPHTGSRRGVKGRTANFVLIRNFLRSAASHLLKDGMVFITIVDNSHYRGTFQLEEAAQSTGFLPPQAYPFNPNAFAEYEHSMTNEYADAIRDHEHFSTYVFRKKPA